MEVYAPWCGHCKAAAPEVKAAAKALKGVGNLAVLDGDKNPATAGKLGIKGFPTFKMIVDGKVSDYTGGRDSKALVGAVMSEMASLVKARLGGGGGGGKSSGGGGSKPAGGKPSGGGGGGANEPGGGKHVIAGTADNFDEEVLSSTDPVLVEFYACVCGGG